MNNYLQNNHFMRSQKVTRAKSELHVDNLWSHLKEWCLLYHFPYLYDRQANLNTLIPACWQFSPDFSAQIIIRYP